MRGGVTLLFMSGVAPIEDVPSCKIPLRDGMPPTEAEWIAEMSGFERVRIRKRTTVPKGNARNSTEWGTIVLEQPTWTREELIGHIRGDPPDTTSWAWSEIARVDAPHGSRVGMGVGMGIMSGILAGLVAGVICGRTHEGGGEGPDFTCLSAVVVTAAIALPAGAAIGGVIGSQTPGWKPIFCAER
jgi:hypothetical protein